MSHNAITHELLEQIRHFIAASRSHVAEGGDVDMSGLDEKVQELCALVMEMPRGDATRYGNELEVLSTELSALKADLTQAQEQVKNQIQGLSLRQKAARAYSQSDNVAPVQSDDDSE